MRQPLQLLPPQLNYGTSHDNNVNNCPRGLTRTSVIYSNNDNFNFPSPMGGVPNPTSFSGSNWPVSISIIRHVGWLVRFQGLSNRPALLMWPNLWHQCLRDMGPLQIHLNFLVEVITVMVIMVMVMRGGPNTTSDIGPWGPPELRWYGNSSVILDCWAIAICTKPKNETTQNSIYCRQCLSLPREPDCGCTNAVQLHPLWKTYCT